MPGTDWVLDKILMKNGQRWNCHLGPAMPKLPTIHYGPPLREGVWDNRKNVGLLMTPEG